MYKEPDIDTKRKSKCIKWIGHVTRSTDDRLTKMVVKEVPAGRRPLGILRYIWII